MANETFTTDAGRTIERELLIAYLNTGSDSAPKWSAFGKRVEESNEEYDWSAESKRDILGNVYTDMKKPTITQSFDPIPLDSGDAAAVKLWNLAVKDQDAQALSNMDVLIAHLYSNGNFAERYTGCAIAVTSIGGSGGGTLDIAAEITYGGERTVGTVTKSDGTVTFQAST